MVVASWLKVLFDGCHKTQSGVDADKSYLFFLSNLIEV